MVAFFGVALSRAVENAFFAPCSSEESSIGELAHSWSFKPCEKKTKCSEASKKSNCTRRKSNCTRRKSNCTLQNVRGPKFWADHPKPQGCYLTAPGLDQWTPRGCTTTAPSDPWRKKPEGGGEKMGIRTHSPRPPQPRHRKKPPPTTAPAL